MEGGLHKAFVDELRDAYDAEKQLIKALPKLARAATSADLRAAFLDHLAETRGQVDRLERVFASLDERVRGKHCDGIAGIIEEGQSILEEDLDPQTLDACLVAAAQRAEHYEMAAYGTLVAWASVMGHAEAEQLLRSILDEEKAADEKLNRLAEGGINQQALSQVTESDDASREGLGSSIKRVVFGTTRRSQAAGSKRASASRKRGRAKTGGATQARRRTSGKSAKRTSSASKRR